MATQLNVKGLHTYEAELSAPEGSLQVADNVDLDVTNAATPRRGFATYGTAGLDPVKQLLQYKNKLMKHAGDKLYYDADDNGTWTQFNGTYTDVQPGVRIKSQELRSNLYITTGMGIKKLSLTNINSINPNSIEPAGVPRALDVVLKIDASNSGILPLESKVSYAAVWGILDGNNATILGYPSAIETASFPGIPQLITDFNALCAALATNTSDSVFNTFKIDTGSDAYYFYNQILKVANRLSAKFDSNNPLAAPYYVWYNSTLSNKNKLSTIETIDGKCYLRFSDELADMMSTGLVPGQTVATYSLPSVLQKAEGLFDVSAVGKLPLTYSAKINAGGNSYSVLSEYSVSAGKVTLKFQRTGDTTSQISNRVVAGQKITIRDCSVDSLNGTYTVLGAGDAPTNDALTFSAPIPNVSSSPITGYVEVSDQAASTARTIVFDVEGIDNTVNITASSSTIGSESSYLGLERPEVPPQDGTYTYKNVTQLATYLDLIVAKLYNESAAVLPSTAGIELVKRSARVTFQVQIPPNVNNTRYFYRIYRSQIQTPSNLLNVDDIVPSQELNLAYEGTISTTELANKITASVIDIASDQFVAQNEPLYTNQQTGEGILQANGIPPVALDVTEFRGRLFFGNTKTQYSLNTTLLSTDNIDDTRSLKLVYKDSVGNTQVVEMSFLEPWASSTVDFANAGPVTSGAASTLELKATDTLTYTVGFVDGTSTFAQDETHLLVDCNTLTTPQQVAAAFANAIITGANEYFDVIYNGAGSIVKVINKKTSPVAFTNAIDIGTAFVTPPDIVLLRASSAYDPITSPQSGVIILYKDENYSISQKIDLTAKAIVNTINQYTGNSIFTAYYNSTENTTPGLIQIEERNIDIANEFYLYLEGVTGSDSQVFNPRAGAYRSVTNVTQLGNVVTVTYTGTAISGNFDVGDFIFLSTTGFTRPVQITGYGTGNFTFTLNETYAGGATGTVGYFETGENQVQQNGLSWSKFQQPDSVPAINFLLIGPQDKKILRIITLRDSLLVFKEEGLYLVFEGNNTFEYRLLNRSCILTAQDSLAIVINKAYCLTTQGVSEVTDNDGVVISRVIKDKIDKILQMNTSSIFGVPSEVDNAYLIFAPNDKRELVNAEQAYRLNVLNGNWSRYELSARCGISIQQNMFLGSGKDFYVEKQRRNLNRTDFADREITDILTSYDYFPNVLEIFSNDTRNYKPGDVVAQTQWATVSIFNNFINKMNIDSGILFYKGSPIPDSYKAQIAVNLNDYINDLIDYLETFNGRNAFGSTTIAPILGNATFAQQRDKYNEIVLALNDVNSDSAAKDYKLLVDGIVFETPIASTNNAARKFRIATLQPFLQGEISVFKSIRSDIIFNPTTFGAPDVLKHIREGTAIFEELYITSGVVKYASDLKPVFSVIPFQGNGNGAWGLYNWGDFYWGGDGPEVPVRTIIPLEKQRCRFLRVGIEHNVAREHYSLYGFSLEANPGSNSTRGYNRR